MWVGSNGDTSAGTEEPVRRDTTKKTKGVCERERWRDYLKTERDTLLGNSVHNVHPGPALPTEPERERERERS